MLPMCVLQNERGRVRRSGKCASWESSASTPCRLLLSYVASIFLYVRASSVRDTLPLAIDCSKLCSCAVEHPRTHMHTRPPAACTYYPLASFHAPNMPHPNVRVPSLPPRTLCSLPPHPKPNTLWSPIEPIHPRVVLRTVPGAASLAHNSRTPCDTQTMHPLPFPLPTQPPARPPCALGPTAGPVPPFRTRTAPSTPTWSAPHPAREAASGRAARARARLPPGLRSRRIAQVRVRALSPPHYATPGSLIFLCYPLHALMLSGGVSQISSRDFNLH